MITHFELATGRAEATGDESASTSWCDPQTVETRLLTLAEAKTPDNLFVSSMPVDLACVPIDRILARFSG